MDLKINTDFIDQLPSDPVTENFTRQVENACFSYVEPTIPEKPLLLIVSKDLLNEVGITDSESYTFLEVFSGKSIYRKTRPYAMCYGGHQFGHWAGQLGDGRAINLFDAMYNGQKNTFQLKGAGETPYSRMADGFAVLRSSIREFLCSEAMYHLGIPTTRALSLMLSGNQVRRDVMYDGNPAYELGAIVCRVSPSFIRFGNFEIFAARKDYENLKKLLDFTIDQYFSIEALNSEKYIAFFEREYNAFESAEKSKYVAFFESVCNRTMDMIVHWQRVGFVHGVMNTDNMSILGLTIDYGPYGWLENYDINWTPNTTDRQFKRYRYGNQAAISLWNLTRLANAIYPIIGEVKPFEEILGEYQNQYERAYIEMMFHKIGLFDSLYFDLKFINRLEELLGLKEVDMTIFFRNLSHVQEDTLSLSPKSIYSWQDLLRESAYNYEEIIAEDHEKWDVWFNEYFDRLDNEGLIRQARIEQMNLFNPKYVLRNYMAQLAIESAEKGDYSLLHELHEMLKNPYKEQNEYEKWFAKRPEWARDKIGCSMLSCSS